MLVQADFFFIDRHKFMLLAEESSGLIGVVSVEILTDSEVALGNVLKKLGLPLIIKAAAPQSHQTVGLAERNVRRMKEIVSCWRSDL